MQMTSDEWLFKIAVTNVNLSLVGLTSSTNLKISVKEKYITACDHFADSQACEGEEPIYAADIGMFDLML